MNDTIPRADGEPRFAWRGLHVDVARHMFPVADLERLLDTMALFRLNRLHWHLTDDQGWRVEIASRPRLTEVGATRAESPRRGDRTKGDGTPYGGFYTQDDVRRLVDYAHERGITVVPEIDMPGHVQAAIAAYPELGHGEPPDVWTRWGVSNRILGVGEATFAFVEDVLGEIAELFPGPWIHLGGDEVPTDEWEASPEAQARIADEGLADARALQGWFLDRAAGIVTGLGRRPVAWDEVLACGAKADFVVMVWRDAAHARTAVERGHEVVLCPMSHCYLDHYQGPPEAEPEAIGGRTDLDRVLAFAPLEHERVLGIQGNLWSEYIRDARHLEYMAWPRAAALAEIGWSGPPDPADFKRRWRRTVVPALARMNVFHRSLDP